MQEYNIHDWYWKETATGRVYSSFEQGYIDPGNNSRYAAFLADGNAPSPFPVDDTPERNESEEWLRRMIEAAGIRFLKLSPEQALEAAKTAKKAAIDKRTDELNLTHGMTYDGKQFSMSQAAKVNWTGMLSLMTAGMVQYPFAILTVADEQYLLKDQNAMQSFLLAVMQYDANPASATGRGRVLRGQVEAAKTIEEVEAVIDDR